MSTSPSLIRAPSLRQTAFFAATLPKNDTYPENSSSYSEESFFLRLIEIRHFVFVSNTGFTSHTVAYAPVRNPISHHSFLFSV